MPTRFRRGRRAAAICRRQLCSARSPAGPTLSATTLALWACCKMVDGVAADLSSTSGAVVLGALLAGQHKHELAGCKQVEPRPRLGRHRPCAPPCGGPRFTRGPRLAPQGQGNDNLGLLLCLLCFQHGLLGTVFLRLGAECGPADGQLGAGVTSNALAAIRLGVAHDVLLRELATEAELHGNKWARALGARSPVRVWCTPALQTPARQCMLPPHAGLCSQHRLLRSSSRRPWCFCATWSDTMQPALDPLGSVSNSSKCFSADCRRVCWRHGRMGSQEDLSDKVPAELNVPLGPGGVRPAALAQAQASR